MKRGHKRENKLRRKSKENEQIEVKNFLNRNKEIKTKETRYFQNEVDNKEKLAQCF